MTTSRRLRRATALLGLVAVLWAGLAACSAPAPNTGPVPLASDGCDVPADLGAGPQTFELTDEEFRGRAIHLRRPARLVAEKPSPVLYMFHGLGSDPRVAVDIAGLQRLADREQALIVAPQGSDRGSGRRGWALSGNELEEEFRFIRAIHDHVSALACVDKDRVYAMGFSNGSAFALTLACRVAIPVAAVGGVSGPAPEQNCVREVPLAYVHGTDDPIIPIGGGSTVIGRLPGARDFVRSHARQMGCEPDPQVEHRGAVMKEQWSRCPGIVYYELDGVSHHWPGITLGDSNTPDRVPATPTPPSAVNEFNATETLWRFFEQGAGTLES